MINGRRSGNYDDFTKLIRLGQHFNCIHFMGIRRWQRMICRPTQGIWISLIATITLSDKITSSMSIGRGRVMDAAKMLAIGRGMTLEELRDSPTAHDKYQCKLTRVLDQEMSDAALTLASLGQAVIITPFTLMGAMTPVTLPAALAQQNAEALFTIALVQSQYPGAPVIYGGLPQMLI